jgi:hypothetical protein
MLAEIHESHDRPTLVFVNFIHEIKRIREKFADAYELRPGNIDAWNRGEIAMLVAHPASAFSYQVVLTAELYYGQCSADAGSGPSDHSTINYRWNRREQRVTAMPFSKTDRP